MNNEENKQLPAENVEENAVNEKSRGKLSRGAIIGIIGGGVALVAAIAVLLAVLLSGGECKSHIDSDNDLKCDSCGVEMKKTDGGETATQSREVTFAVRIDGETAVSGVKFTLTRNAKDYNLVAGADGTVKQTLAFGTYDVSFDYETLPEYSQTVTSKITISSDEEIIYLELQDNTPDGSADKPFFVSEINTPAITVEAGQEIFINCRIAADWYVVIENENAIICYDGNEYPAEGGVCKVLISHNTSEAFSVKTSGEAFTAEVKISAPLGSRENPYKITSLQDGLSLALSAEQIVYYEWTADREGDLTITTSTHESLVAITRILEDYTVVAEAIEGADSATLAGILVGDSIILEISVNPDAGDAPVNVVITLEVQ